jgi:hypothetical protein
MVILANLVKYIGQIFQFSIWLTSNIVHWLSNWIDDVQQNVRRAIIIATTISGTILLLVIAISSWLLWRNKQKHYVLLHQAQEKFAEFDVQPTIFSYSELRAATKDFHPDMKLGQGSYGVVYKVTFSLI